MQTKKGTTIFKTFDHYSGLIAIVAGLLIIIGSMMLLLGFKSLVLDGRPVFIYSEPDYSNFAKIKFLSTPFIVVVISIWYLVKGRKWIAKKSTENS